MQRSLEAYLFHSAAKAQWKKIGAKKMAGVMVPLFSVYSENSLCVGDFSDLKLLIDWCALTGNSILQLLPLNETGTNFCPYDAVSSFALDPLYFAHEFFAPSLSEALQEKVTALRKHFPQGQPHLDYRVKREKLRLLFEVFRQEKAFPEKFIQEQAFWLKDFALFQVLKEFHNQRPWFTWEEKYRQRDKKALEEFSRQYQEKINFQIWLQWQLYRQFKQVKEYAQEKKVLVKGDLPMLVSRDSADVWQNPDFFKLEFAAGAPPDMYCAKGQRWGMPTYHWQNIASNGYHYLKEKLKYAENFYHLLRIDHVVGLFRIWSIPYQEPLENQGLNGFFDPQDESIWEMQGKEILLAMLTASDLLLCAEDLGVIPRVCTQTLHEFGIPGNEVQRWVKDWDERHTFLNAAQYREISVAMLSTHDTTNWVSWWKYEAGTIDEALFIRKCNERGIDYTIVRDQLFDLDLSYHGRLRWLSSVDTSEKLLQILGKPWHEAADLVQIYLNSYQEKEKLWKLLSLPGKMQEEANPELVRRILQFTLDAKSIFCIQSIIDWLSLGQIFSGDSYQYRINTPGVVSEKNWSLTLPLSLEKMLQHKVCQEINKMISSSGRLLQ
jgi:4-alpha-glucanotransferase